jgi:hypothetical protein
MATPNAHQLSGNGINDGILAKLKSADGSMVWATYFGGEGQEHGRSVVLDANDNIYINGWTLSTTAIATPGSFMETKFPEGPSSGPNEDGYVAKFNSDGVLQWATYFGGPGNDIMYNMINDEEGNLYFCGRSSSQIDIVYGEALQKDKKASGDGFISKMDVDGHLTWSTYFGSDGMDEIYDLDRDADGYLYFNLSTTDALATTAGTYKEKLTGGTDIAVFKAMIEPGCTDKYEPNESLVTAAIIEANDNTATYGFKASISSETDEDWYSVKLKNDKPNLSITLTDLMTPMNIQLLNSSGAIISETTGTTTNDQVLSYNATIGATYYIHVSYSGLVPDAAGCYRLQTLRSKTAYPLKEAGDATVVDANVKIDVFPNPCISLINVHLFANETGDMEQVITDAMGRRVLVLNRQVVAGLNEWQTDVSTLPAGIYYLSCFGKFQMVSQSFVVTR